MLYKIEKSNTSGRWSGRQWWVEAHSEAAAIQQGRKNWPSKNDTDQYHATPLTQEEIDGYYREQAEHEIRRAERRIKSGVPVTSRSTERIAAYIDRCQRNVGASLGRLDSRGVVPEGVMRHLDDLAHRLIDHGGQS